MRRAILHVGTPRTGTTSFQKALAGARDRLLDAGVLYPELTPRSAGEPHLSHQHLGEALDGRRPGRERRELLERLDAELASTSAEVVFISYERLWLSPAWRRAPARLRDLFERRGFRPEALVTVRPQAGYVQSQYSWRIQFLREGRSFGQAFPGELRRPALDYARRLAPWARAFEGRVRAAPLHDLRSTRPLGARIADELALADRLAPVLESPRELRENVSLGPVSTEVSRRLRRGGVRLSMGEGRRVMDRVQALAAALPEERAPFRALTPEMADRARRRFSATNAAFAAAVWGQPWSARVAEAKAADPTELAGAALAPELEAQVVEIGRRAAAEFGLSF